MSDICIIPGHAILKGDDPRNEDDWILESFQRDGGHHLKCFEAHLRVGFAWLYSNPTGRLVLSGGYTRAGCRRSEAESYLLAAQKFGLVGDSDLFSRVVLEEHARDSLENVLYGIAAGYAAIRRRITRVTAVGFEFKRRRFLDHFASLQLGPGMAYEFWGINNPIEPQLSPAIASEAATRKAFASKSPDSQAMLRAKRDSRSFGERPAPYAALCLEWPELYAKLTDWDSLNA